MRLPLRSPLEWMELLTEPSRWRVSTALSTIGFIGMIANLAVVLTSFALTGNQPKIWKFFAYLTLFGCGVELGQAYIKQGENPIRFSASSDELASRRQQREAGIRGDRSA